MSACIAAHRGDNGHQNRQRDDLRNRGLELRNHHRRCDRGQKVHRKPRQTLLCRFYHAVGQRALPDTGKPQNVFFVLLVEHGHGVINGDHTDQTAFVVDNRGRNQVVLVERIGHIAFVTQGGDDLKRVF